MHAHSHKVVTIHMHGVGELIAMDSKCHRGICHTLRCVGPPNWPNRPARGRTIAKRSDPVTHVGTHPQEGITICNSLN